jgi:hypothetical protein
MTYKIFYTELQMTNVVSALVSDIYQGIHNEWQDILATGNPPTFKDLVRYISGDDRPRDIPRMGGKMNVGCSRLIGRPGKEKRVCGKPSHVLSLDVYKGKHPRCVTDIYGFQHPVCRTCLKLLSTPTKGGSMRATPLDTDFGEPVWRGVGADVEGVVPGDNFGIYDVLPDDAERSAREKAQRELDMLIAKTLREAAVVAIAARDTM